LRIDLLQTKQEIKTWRNAAVIMILFSVFAFLTQRFVVRLFNDIILEVCIFYLPALVSLLLYIYFRQRL